MKYPQLVSNRAVSTISDWLVTRLEVLGVEAPIVYSRLLLSLLHTPLQVNSVDAAEIPQLKNWLGKRFNSRRLTQSDAERLKRVAAIESLMEVVEANEKRSRIVDLVSELCGKLRELERSEEDQVAVNEVEQLQEDQGSSAVEERRTANGGEREKRNSGGSGGESASTAADKSNPYYQMFPALSGNIPSSSNSSSRGTSLSGNSGSSAAAAPATAVTMSGGAESNWGRGDNQLVQQANAAKWRMMTTEGQGGEATAQVMMSNGSPTPAADAAMMGQELFTGGGGGGSGDKGNSSKRKNKKRRTNGPSGDKRMFATSSPVAAPKMKLGNATNFSCNSAAVASGVGRHKKSTSTSSTDTLDFHGASQQPLLQPHHRQRGKPQVEWDTNFSGQWEMEEQDPIRQFRENAQRSAATTKKQMQKNSAVTGAATADNGYDNVFKMKRSEVNEEQTMIIKSFLNKMGNAAITATNSCNRTILAAEEAELESERKLKATENLASSTVGAFNFELAEDEYLNLISPIDEGAAAISPIVRGGFANNPEDRRRLFERETTMELDAKLDAFKAKFDTSIRNLWSQDEAQEEQQGMAMNSDVEFQAEQPPSQPMSLNSFWQNYNKHVYEFQGDPQQREQLDGNNNNNAWPVFTGEGQLEPPQEKQELLMMNNNFNMNVFNQSQPNAPAPNTTIWSNDLNEYEEQNEIQRQQYNEQMAAAYEKQMIFQSAGGMQELGLLSSAAPLTGGPSHLDLFAMSKWAPADGGIFDNSNLNTSAELEQIYFASGAAPVTPFPPAEDRFSMCQSAGMNEEHEAAVIAAEVANMKLEQSIALINHSQSSSFAKVDRNWALAQAAAVAAATEAANNLAEEAKQRANRMRNSGVSSITNLSSLYGSFKQNSMENLLTSERTHFRPIKQAYVDGHTFDIPCSPDTIEYVRSASGSMFFELDKYMEYNVEEHGRDACDEQQQSTNVPISRCGTIDVDCVDPLEVGHVKRAKKQEDHEQREGHSENSNKFTLKFCVRSENEKCCQTEVIDYEQVQRQIEAAEKLKATMKKYPKNVLPKCTLSEMDDADLEAVAYELLEDKWNHQLNHPDMSMLWETSGSNSLDSNINYELSLPANRMLRDELTADAEEILKDSLNYMQNLYIDDMEDEMDESAAELELDDQQDVTDAVRAKNDVNLASYYGQLISEMLNPAAAKKIVQALRTNEATATTGGENDILWYKNWSQRNWLPLPQVTTTTAAADAMGKAKNVWQYGGEVGGEGNGWESQETVFSRVSNEVANDNNNNCVSLGGEVKNFNGEMREEKIINGFGEVQESSLGNSALDDWKFSNLRKLWSDTQLNHDTAELEKEFVGKKLEVSGGGEEGGCLPNGLFDDEEEEEEEENGDVGNEEEEEEDDDAEKNYHLIIFEKKDPSAIASAKTSSSQLLAAAKGRKRRHSASQNLFDDDLEWFNGDEVKWYDYCCKCDCGKRSEKILRYRNKLLMKRVDKMGHVHNASLLLKNFKQFDSIDEILNEGLICNAAAVAMGAAVEMCELIEGGGGEYCGIGGEGGGNGEKLNNLEQVSLLKNPNMYLNRTALISMSRPLTR